MPEFPRGPCWRGTGEATIDDLQMLIRVAVGMAIGLLIGLEREWQFQSERRVGRAGVRTFALLGLIGALGALAPGQLGNWLVPAIVLAVALYFHAGLRIPDEALREDITSAVAGIVTVLLGAAAVIIDMTVAVSAAVAMTILLALKPTLHRWIGLLTEQEIRALLRFLVIAAVVLPVLPDRGYGPYQVLNPFKIWFIVVAICGVSFAGYVIARVVGQRGQLLVGLVGGLVSSTAVTAGGAQQSRAMPLASRALAMGTIAACSVMAARIIVIGVAISPALLPVLAAPLATMAAAGAGIALLMARTTVKDSEAASEPSKLPNPFELSFALRFAVLIGAISLLSRWLQELWGNQALYLVAVAGGLADVDAVLAAAASALTPGAEGPWGLALLIAAATNNTVKAGIALAGGTRSYGLWVAAGLGTMTLAAAAALLIQRLVS